ncbi:SNF2-related protein [Saccharopolyspora sp. ASAGF58]|uniref:DEAD/DEAH box helicase n=1 Tax=Saccharopolyspora sp. ASAGF58 TaxID=2719023 RepID=UPI0014402B93|nr:SNF2-related protein [Saccharopolyspora sp. ASAGF58]QIZ38412.1 helicase [Saccharopolyspora sp. ASAGF58]
MQLVSLQGVDLDTLRAVVDDRSYTRGVQYAEQHAVVRMHWDDPENALAGTVHGRTGDFYQTVAYFRELGGASLGFAKGKCDCPVSFNCKHVVALVLTATQERKKRPAPPRPARQAQKKKQPTTRRAQADDWERVLGALLEPQPNQPTYSAEALPVAIELSVQKTPAFGRAPAPAPRLMARLVRPGRSGWVAGNLNWSKVSSPHYYYGEYLDSHLRVLQELYAFYQASSRHSGYYGEVKTIDLSEFGSRQLWPLLDEAKAVGLRLVHARKALGDVARYAGELCLDAREHDGTLAVAPTLHIDGESTDAVPILFIGREGHGAVCVDRARLQGDVDLGQVQLRLIKLARGVPQQLQQMVRSGQRLEIPTAESARFSQQYFPRLRHLAPIISADESFTPPAISDPTLVLHADYGAKHNLELSWEWAYDIGEEQRRAPLAADQTGAAGYRDLVAEREVLAGLNAPLDQFGLRGYDPEPSRSGHAALNDTALNDTALDAIDTMRFTTELLPLLDDQPGVAVEVSGEPADYREVSDSLQIGVATHDVSGETDWFDLGVSIRIEGREVPFARVFSALATDQTHLLLDDGAYFSLQKPELQTLYRLIEEARTLHDSPGETLRISRFQAGLWDELAALGVVDGQATAWRKQVQGLLSLESLDSPDVPATLAAQLRSYQRDGFDWLAFLWRHRLGGILADDMGLGKTVQSLALICHAKDTEPDGAPFLIVAPTSVVSNWASEADRFAPGLTTVPITETRQRRGQDLDAAIEGADVVITSYALFRIDFDEYHELPWSGLILDEAQFVKNHQSKIYQCARRLPTEFKLAVTGTPMENNLMELWSLLSITSPGLFPNPTKFRHYYATPIEKQADTELLAQLRRRVRPLVKRRTKEQVVADLPEKQEQVLNVDLHPRHRKLYQTHLQRERQKVLGLIDDMNKHRFTILRSLTLLRQLSLHAGLVGDEHRDMPSAKLDTLIDQLRDVAAGGHRALVFSQFTGFLDTVRARLATEGLDYCYLDGKTRARASVLKRFKEGSAPVFVISLKAGGFGLNLTEADYCFLLDPWWNPATEAQAVDRTHRIGQTRNVMVYRLIARDTIEEKVMALKARKSELFAGVMDEGNLFGAGLNAEDIRELLT